jgi:hypothetical protein
MMRKKLQGTGPGAATVVHPKSRGGRWANASELSLQWMTKPGRHPASKPENVAVSITVSPGSAELFEAERFRTAFAETDPDMWQRMHMGA